MPMKVSVNNLEMNWNFDKNKYFRIILVTKILKFYILNNYNPIKCIPIPIKKNPIQIEPTIDDIDTYISFESNWIYFSLFI